MAQGQHAHMTVAWQRVLRAGLATLALLASAMPPAVGQPEVLRPEQAFRYEVAAEGSDVVLRWNIEPGYYLYKERMSVAARTPGVTLGTPVMPEGLPYSDEFFGDMHIYRGEVAVRIPVQPPLPGVLELDIRSQGCADIGLCYPPQTWPARVAFAAASAAPPGGGLSRLFGTAPTDAPLPPEKAFRVSATLVDAATVQVTWDITDGYYLYRDSLAAESASPGITLGNPHIPPGEPKEDEYFGLTEVFHRQVIAEWPVSGRADPLQLRITHQGCKENSICYPPQTLLLTVGEGTVAQPAAALAPLAPMVSEQDQLAGMIRSGNLALVMLSFAGFGLLLAFTPCCLPMVPILSGIIVGQGPNLNTAPAFALSLTYVLGMALTYTAAGALAAAAGSQLQAALQQPWIIIGVSALFIALALAMFGLYELRVPTAWMNRLNAASGRQKVGTYFGTAAMGALSALVVTTCVAPPLVATLTVIAGTGDVTRGALALFALAMGMGLPLLAVGTSAGRLLPKSGPWMTTVKGAFGFMMLGLAIWMLDRVIPDAITMMLWAALVFMAGVFLGAFQPLEAAAGTPRKLAKGMGLLAAIYGAALLVGGLAGGRNPLQPLEAFQGQGLASEAAHLPFRRIKTVADFDQALAAARAGNQPLMLDFYADWCASCLEMERYTFTSPLVRAALEGALLLRADVTANDAADKALLARFGIFGPPTIVFFGPDGAEREGYRVVGFKNASDFAGHVRRAFGG